MRTEQSETGTPRRERMAEAARLERVEESKKEMREIVAGHPSNDLKRQVMREIGLRVIVHTHGHKREATTSLEIQCGI